MIDLPAGIRLLESAEHGRWDLFVRETEGGTFYHLSGWKTLIEEQLNHSTYYMYCEDEGEIVGVLPLARVSSWLFGDALISTPFLVYGGPVSKSEHATESLVRAARELARRLRVDYLELRNREPLPGDWLQSDTYVTFRKSIHTDAEDNLKAIPRKQRAMIRKGIDAGLVAETDRTSDRLYVALLECKRNLGTPFFDRHWLEAIVEEFDDMAEVTTITHEGRIVCSVMSFRFGNEILPYYGGGGELARHLKGNDFMYWAVMERAGRRGVEIFDYGRSKVGSGAYRFKKHWGFEPEPLCYQYHLVGASELPDLSPTSPRYRFLVRAWQKLPLAVAHVVGPPLARRLA